MNKKSKGFTLIELLVVIAIIGILATIVLVSLNSARIKARDSRRVSDIRQIQLALELYGDSSITYPNVDIYPNGGPLVPTFMAAVPHDAGDNTRQYYYFYCNQSGGRAPLKYQLGADLEESTATPLNSDSDYDSTGIACDVSTGYDGFTIDGTAVANGMTGVDTESCLGGDVGRFCYDIAN
jgi:prepilin-type N-terminal cleavage/methylation domain-containing protein